MQHDITNVDCSKSKLNNIKSIDYYKEDDIRLGELITSNKQLDESSSTNIPATRLLIYTLALTGILYILRTLVYCKRLKCTIASNSRGGTGNLPCLRIVLLFLWMLMILPTVLTHQQDHQACPGCPRDRDHHAVHHHSHGHNHHTANHHRQQSKTTDGRKGGDRDVRNDPSPDDLRLEAIKHQILTKLGLRGRPDVNKTLASVPRKLALKTLYRAEAQPQPLAPTVSGSSRHHSNTVYRNRGIYNEESHNVAGHTYGEFSYGSEEYSYRNMEQPTERTTLVTEASSTTTSTESSRDHAANDGDPRDEQPQEELDDFYARTSEIITFAEPGRWNDFGVAGLIGTGVYGVASI